jgi:hypothetical protein
MEKTRPLLIAVIVMGVLVVLGTSVVIVKVVKDIIGGSSHATADSAGVSPDTIMLTTNMLSQPLGSHIVTITGLGERLGVLINGGGPDRILFVDPATGHVTGQLMLGK